jgi:hypothetical protein
MADWSDLHTAYGSARGVPMMIEAWIRDPTDDNLTDLWSHLCHQGTVYSASYAAIPLLADAIAHLAPKERREALILAGSILSSTDGKIVALKESLVSKELLVKLDGLLTAEMRSAEVDAEEFIYLAQCFNAFRGGPDYGAVFDRLADGEFEGECGGCGHELLASVDSTGRFIAAEDYITKPKTRRIPIEPLQGNSHPAALSWLHELAIKHGQTEVCARINHLCGTSQCPTCENPVDVWQATEFAKGDCER